MIKRDIVELEAENEELRARVRRLEDYLFGKPGLAIQPEAGSQRDEAMAKKLDEFVAMLGKALESMRGAVIAYPLANPMPTVPCVPFYPQVQPTYPVNPGQWRVTCDLRPGEQTFSAVVQ